MDFSTQWKSNFTISSIFDPPLLISSPSSSSQLGPLLFAPDPQTLNPLISSPLLSNPFTIPPLSFPRIKPDKPLFTRPPTFNNTLNCLKLPNSELLVVFPYGYGLQQVGFVTIGENWKVSDDGVVEMAEEFDGEIRGIAVSAADWMEGLDDSGIIVVGFLLAFTFDTLHWYRVEVNEFGKPDLAYLGSRKFGCSVVRACLNSGYCEESLVLLENGDLFLFNVEDCCRAHRFPVTLEGSKVSVLWEGEENGERKKWLSCAFSWHPRIFVVACDSAVFLVDWMYEESKVTVLAKIGMFHLNRTVKNSRFIAFCMAGSDGFYFTVATEENLFLMDIRRPIEPLLQWAHGLDNPHCINVFRVSELRSMANEDKYNWASDSGFAILLGSFLNCKFSLFCYGPPLPAADKSVASKVYEYCNTLFAWELPSDISLLGHQCSCGDCLLENDFSNGTLPYWKKEMILGFCIIDLSSQQTKSDGLGGFTLIRLLSSGKLESQKYFATYDFTNLKSIESKKKSTHLNGSFLDLFIHQPYKFPRRFRYIHLDFLLGFMNDNLPKVLASKMKKTSKEKNCEGSSKLTPYIKDFYERICDILRGAGVDSIGFCPSIESVLDGISWPMNIHEIASNRMWGGLSVDHLQFAFTLYSELVGVLIEHRKISLEALDIPTLPQLPPFFSKMPTSRGHKWSWKFQLGDVLVGPVLPLPCLLALNKVTKDTNCLISEEAESQEAEMKQQCNKVVIVASEIALPVSQSELIDAPAVSLASDTEERLVVSQELKPLFFHTPSAFSKNYRSIISDTPSRSVCGDEMFDTFISRTREKDLTSSSMKQRVGLDFFNDTCPIELNFDFPEMDFTPKELKEYKLLKKEYIEWQKKIPQYQDFCTLLKSQQKAP